MPSPSKPSPFPPPPRHPSITNPGSQPTYERAPTQPLRFPSELEDPNQPRAVQEEQPSQWALMIMQRHRARGVRISRTGWVIDSEPSSSQSSGATSTDQPTDAHEHQDRPSLGPLANANIRLLPLQRTNAQSRHTPEMQARIALAWAREGVDIEAEDYYGASDSDSGESDSYSLGSEEGDEYAITSVGVVRGTARQDPPYFPPDGDSNAASGPEVPGVDGGMRRGYRRGEVHPRRRALAPLIPTASLTPFVRHIDAQASPADHPERVDPSTNSNAPTPPHSDEPNAHRHERMYAYKKPRCMRLRDIPPVKTGADCMFHLDDRYSIAFCDIPHGLEGRMSAGDEDEDEESSDEDEDEGREVRRLEAAKRKKEAAAKELAEIQLSLLHRKLSGDGVYARHAFTHAVLLHHGPPSVSMPPLPSSSPDPQPAPHATPSESGSNKQPTVILPISLPPNPVSDTLPTPPAIPTTDADIDSIHTWLEPSGLGVSRDRVRDILCPTEDITARLNHLNLRSTELNQLRTFVRSGGAFEKIEDEDEARRAGRGWTKRVLILAPRNRRTDGMAALVASVVALSPDRELKARMVISSVDARGDMRGTPWRGVLHMSMAGRLDEDTLF